MSHLSTNPPVKSVARFDNIISIMIIITINIIIVFMMIICKSFHLSTDPPVKSVTRLNVQSTVQNLSSRFNSVRIDPRTKNMKRMIKMAIGQGCQDKDKHKGRDKDKDKDNQGCEYNIHDLIHGVRMSTITPAVSGDIEVRMMN